jgi:hypothetical protein
VSDSLLYDSTRPVSDAVRALTSRDLARWSHGALLPLARVFSLSMVALIRLFKRVLPFQFRSHRGIDVLCVWFIRHFVSADAAELLALHFIVETNLLAFIAGNCGKDVRQPALRPSTIAAVGNHAVIDHDIAVYTLVNDVALAGADVVMPRDDLHFGALEVPVIDAERSRDRWLELDVETSLYLMNVPFCLFTTESEYERAVNSFQLDDDIGAMLAGLTGDPIFRTWTPVPVPAWIAGFRDVPRELFWHAAVCEYAHTRLEQLARERRMENVERLAATMGVTE